MTDNPPRARSRGLKTPYSVEVNEGKRERLPRNATLDRATFASQSRYPPAPGPAWPLLR